jgi:hypothetical protein
MDAVPVDAVPVDGCCGDVEWTNDDVENDDDDVTNGDGHTRHSDVRDALLNGLENDGPVHLDSLQSNRGKSCLEVVLVTTMCFFSWFLMTLQNPPLFGCQIVPQFNYELPDDG